MTSCDICVIGAGSAGLTVAAVASQFGQKVVLIEKGEMGGDCLNTGCVPSKALLAAARQAQAMRKSGPFGISPVSPDIDFAKVMVHVRSVIAAIEPNDSQERFEKLGAKVIRAAARFTAPDRVEAGGETISARRFVVATGSRAAVPPIPGLDAVPHFTNETLFGNTRCPEHLIIIGGGPIGLEMAQAHLRLGARVTVVEAFSPLAKDDPELMRVVVDYLREEGVAIHDHTKIVRVRQDGDAVAIDTEKAGVITTLTGSHILVAAGRKPNVENLGLEVAGIATDKRGIVTDESLRTSNRRVYAIGDVAGGPQFTHVAGFQGALVVKHALFRLPVKKSATPIPWVTYTDPELAQVGLTEAEARKTHGDVVQVLRFPYHDNDRAVAERKTAGMAKIVVGKGGRILGAGIVGANAGEIIGTWSLAMASGLKVKHLASMVFPYPTLGEINKRAAVTYYADLAGNSWVRRLIGFLARFN